MNFHLNLNRFLALMALCTIVVFSSCKKDDDDGDKSEDRIAFVGTYNALEDCDGSEDDYSLTIALDTDSEDGVLINNIYGDGETTKATVDGSDLTVASQAFNVYGGVTASNISGTGTLVDSVFTLNFAIEYTGYPVENCVATCTKQ